MAAYFFVAATVVAIIPILIVFKVFIEKIRETPEEMNKIMTRYMMWIVIIEALPIILIVLGFMYLEPVSSISELYLPGSIVLLTFGFAILFILLQSFVDIEVNTMQFRMISIMLVLSIPFISFMGFALMLA